MIKFKKSLANAVVPSRGSELAAGFDLSAATSGIIPPSSQAIISTGIKVEMPEDVWGHILPRSGLAVRHSINTHAGVIDADYRGVINVILFNHGVNEFRYEQGDRIAQIVFSPYIKSFVEVSTDEDLSETLRGTGGFGSTGVSRMDVVGQNGNDGLHYPTCEHKAD